MLSTITRLGSLKAHTLAVQATKNGVAATALRTFAVAGSGHPIHPMIRQVLHIIPPERIQDTEKLEVAMEGEIDKYAKTKGLDSIEFMNDWRALETAANALMKRARGGEDVGLSAAGLKDGDQPLKMEGVQESGRPGKEASADVPKDVRDKASSGGNNKKAADATSSSKTSATAGSTTAGTTNGQGGGARKPHKPAPREAGEAAMAGEGPINL